MLERDGAPALSVGADRAVSLKSSRSPPNLTLFCFAPPPSYTSSFKRKRTRCSPVNFCFARRSSLSMVSKIRSTSASV
jgi:hypothetical protein